jgi:hypothetical protein
MLPTPPANPSTVYNPNVPLSPAAIYKLAIQAGFPSVVATTMTAIALRESAGVPSAYNGDSATGDDSWGLLQINLAGALKAPRMKLFGITDESQLLDPLTNMRAGYKLWAGNNKNLSLAWYIDHPGVYQTRYESHLPAAQTAALASM